MGSRAHGQIAIAFTLGLACLGHVSGQNLVPNGSFEQYTLCPSNSGQVLLADGWSIISQSPDYFNRCNSNDSVDVPHNIAGYQEPFHGDAYMGVATYHQGIPTYRECIQRPLAAPLTPGVPVYIL